MKGFGLAVSLFSGWVQAGSKVPHAVLSGCSPAAIFLDDL